MTTREWNNKVKKAEKEAEKIAAKEDVEELETKLKKIKERLLKLCEKRSKK